MAWIFAEINECPYCEKDLERELDRYFRADGDYNNEFDFDCPACKKTFHVSVRPLPEFECIKQEDNQ